MFRRRRPLARAAMIGGGAYALGKRSGQGSAADGDQVGAADGGQDDQAVPAAPSGGLSDSAVGQLEQLGELKERGVLTIDEFNEQKKKILEAT
jgi:Short C-terminal domain